MVRWRGCLRTRQTCYLYTTGQPTAVEEIENRNRQMRNRKNHFFFFVCCFQDPKLMDKKGVVRTVSGNTCTVYLYDEKRDVSVSINNVDPGEPVKQDKVCCISGLTSYILVGIILALTGAVL